MQGSGLSSLAIWTAFDDMTTATWRTLKWAVNVAWTRISNSSIIAIVGTSLVDGIDLVQGQTTPVTKPDQFSYFDETTNAIQLEYDREVIEPVGGIALAQGDVKFVNTDLRFTPNKDSTIGTALKPNRPINYHIGFQVMGQQKTIPVFKGLTDQPKEDKAFRTVNIHCFDYIKVINEFPLDTTIFQNQRTDQIISEVLQDVGFSTDQFVLDTGINTIEFAWIKKGQSAGKVIRELCESEEGFFYQDENGILRFENRWHYINAPHTQVVWTINQDDIISWQQDNSTPIINRCIVKANPREVQATQEVWRNGTVEEVPASSSITRFANFENPVTGISGPTATTDYIANAAADGSGADKTADVTIVPTLFTDAVKLVITNSSGSTAYVTFLRIRGTPATIISTIEQTYQDDDSVNNYGTQQYVLENNYIDDADFAEALASHIVTRAKSPLQRIKVRVQGIPQLQLKDRVRVYDMDLAVYKEYRVMGIKGVLEKTYFWQDLYLREITAYENEEWALVDTATVDGTDTVGL